MDEPECQSEQTVLIVDRDLGLLARVCQICMNAGYQAVPASSVEEAVSLVAALAIDVDVIIIGAAILQEASVDVIRKLQQCRNIKLVVTVGQAESLALDREIARNIRIVATIRRLSRENPRAEAELLQTLEDVLAAEG